MRRATRATKRRAHRRTVVRKAFRKNRDGFSPLLAFATFRVSTRNHNGLHQFLRLPIRRMCIRSSLGRCIYSSMRVSSSAYLHLHLLFCSLHYSFALSSRKRSSYRVSQHPAVLPLPFIAFTRIESRVIKYNLCEIQPSTVRLCVTRFTFVPERVARAVTRAYYEVPCVCTC